MTALRTYEGSDIKNVALAGHGHCGKTSLVAALLYTTGATNRLTRVDDGNTITDHDEEEIERKFTISTALTTACRSTPGEATAAPGGAAGGMGKASSALRTS